MPRALRSPCPEAAKRTTATLALCSCLSAATASGACLPEEITYRLEADPSSASSSGNGGGGGACVDEPGQGGTAGAGGGEGGAPCVRCWQYAVSGEAGQPCTCSADLYQAYESCICAECAGCTICGGTGDSADCSACYQQATEQTCQAVHRACLDD